MLKKIVWIISLLMNTFVIFRTNPSALIADNLFMLVGRLIGIYVMSYLLTLPLKLMKKDELAKKLLPFMFLILTMILFMVAAVNYEG